MLFNRQPCMLHLRAIGSTCYNHKTGKVTGKLDERATICYLVGYDSEKIYRVCDPSSRKVFRSPDLVIHEITQPSDRSEALNQETVIASNHEMVQTFNDIFDNNIPPRISNRPVRSTEEPEPSPSFN